MLQQLQLSFDSFAVELETSPVNPLVEQTRELFQHQGSDAELVELIQTAIDAIHELCETPHT